MFSLFLIDSYPKANFFYNQLRKSVFGIRPPLPPPYHFLTDLDCD